MLCSNAANTNLAAFGVNPHIKNNAGATPLMIALRGGFHEVVSLLLEYHADRDAVDSKGKTAFDYAPKVLLPLLEEK